MSPENTESTESSAPAAAPPLSSNFKPRDRRALNAYRHGLTGHVLLITAEDEPHYKQHCQAIHQSLAPVGGLEIDLAQQVADDRWRLKTANSWAGAVVARGLYRPDDYCSGHEQVDAALAGGRIWLKDNASFDRLALYEGRLQRRVEKNLALIRQLQHDRISAAQQIIEQAALLGESYEFPPEALPPNFVFSPAQVARLAAHHKRLIAAGGTPLRLASTLPPRPKKLPRAA